MNFWSLLATQPHIPAESQVLLRDYLTPRWMAPEVDLSLPRECTHTPELVSTAIHLLKIQFAFHLKVLPKEGGKCLQNPNFSKAQPVYDVRFPSICCRYVLLPLVQKEAALAYGRREIQAEGQGERRWSWGDANNCRGRKTCRK